MTSVPQVTFGLIADVQYADVDDTWNYTQTKRRFYRRTLEIQSAAVDAWTEEARKPQGTLRFAVDLGDLIDLRNVQLGQSQVALQKTLQIYSRFQDAVGPVHHVVGNHEMYNMTRTEYIQELMMHTASPHEASVKALPPKDAKKTYYSFSVPQAPSFEFIVLDAYGFSAIGSPKDTEEYRQAVEFLASKNPNSNKNISDGLEGIDRRFAEYNGAVDDEQLAWLKKLLSEVKGSGRNAIIFIHISVHPSVVGDHLESLLWNCEEVLAIFREYKACVRAVFSGHTHINGYACDEGIHFVGLHAPLECDPSDSKTDRAFASVDVYPSHLHVRGAGIIPDYTLSW